MSYLTERLLNAQYHNHEEDCCCGECGCENEHNQEELVEKSLSESEIEEIINEKYSEKDEKTKEFIRKGLRKFGDRFDYSKTVYIKAQEKVTITCIVKDHGDFEINPSNFLTRGRCQKCGQELYSEHTSHTTEQFIIAAKEIHDNKYDYSKVNYINNSTKVIIICPIHGEFLQIPANHLSGAGCPICANNIKLTAEQFIERVNEIHNNKYDYSKVNYVNSKTHVTIICPIHGEFLQTPAQHLSGHGCPLCSGNAKLTTEQFIKRANEVHGGGTYLYNRVNYVNSNTPVEIYDPLYEEYFFQSPDVHLRGCGNPNRRMSSGERQVYLWLKSMNIDFNREVLLENTFGRHGNGIIVDFIIDNYNNHKIIIEYNGGQHYKFTTKFHSTVEDFNAQLKRDDELRDYCKINSIMLIELPFILKTSTEISDFLTKTLIEEINQHELIDYDSLYVFDDSNST